MPRWKRKATQMGRDGISTTVAEQGLDTEMEGRVVNGNSHLLRDAPVTLVSPRPCTSELGSWQRLGQEGAGETKDPGGDLPQL